MKSYNNHLRYLDEMRGLSALAVFTAHFLQQFDIIANIGIWGNVFKTLGSWGVSVFFILSGFLIHYNTLLEFSKKGNISWSAYFIRRFFRIYPSYFVCLVFSFLIGRFFQSNMIFYGDYLDFLSHIFMISTYFPDYYDSINAIFWTVIVEMHFYFAYPILWYLLKFKSFWFVFLVCFIFGQFVFICSSFSDSISIKLMYHHSSLVLFWKWVLGVGLAQIFFFSFDFYSKFFYTFWMSFLFFIISFVPGFILPSYYWLQFERFAFPVLNFFLIATLLFSNFSILEVKTLKWVGKVSYSFYLWHPLVLIISIYLDNFFSFFINFVLSLFISLIVSWFFYAFLEVKSISLGVFIKKYLI